MKNAFILGLQYAGILIGVTIVAYGLGADIYFSFAFTAIGFVLSKYLIWHFGKTYRDKYRDGFVSFGQLFLPLMTIIFSGYVLGTLFQLLLMEVIDPEMKRLAMEAGLDQAADIYKAIGMSDREIDKALDDAQELSAFMSIIQYVGGIVGGLFYSAFWAAIFGLLIRREKPFDPMTHQS